MRKPTLRVTAALGIAVVLGVLAAGPAGADTTYTGCLTGGGTLTRVAVGTSPKGSCSPNETQVSWTAGSPGVAGFYRRTASFACPGVQGDPNCLINPLPVAQCDAGDVATGGAGYRTVTSPPGVPLQDFAAIPFPTISADPPVGFTTTAQTIGPGDTVFVVAICANLP